MRCLFQQSFFSAVLNHRQSDSVFDASARICFSNLIQTLWLGPNNRLILR
jgi:hypothetical protein